MSVLLAHPLRRQGGRGSRDERRQANGDEIDGDACAVLAAIPVASSGFYAKLMAGIIRAFDDAKKRGWVEAAMDRGTLWRAILKATRVTTK